MHFGKPRRIMEEWELNGRDNIQRTYEKSAELDWSKSNKIKDVNIQPDILLIIPSRGNPDGLEKMFHQLVDTCYNRNNFDILFIIDNDQKHLYEEIIKNCSPDSVVYIEHLDDNWSNIQHAGNKVFESKDYYFACRMVDDIYGISNGWDEAIVERKHFYKDDIFILYNTSTVFGRNGLYHENCYYIKGKCLVVTHGESVLVYTKKIYEFINPLFEDPNKFKGLKEYVYSTMIFLLYKIYNEKRNIKSNFSFNDACNNYNSIRIFNEIWPNIEADDFKDLKDVAKKIKEYIDIKKITGE